MDCKNNEFYILLFFIFNFFCKVWLACSIYWCNLVILHLHTLRYNHHTKSHNCLPLCKVTTLFLTTFPFMFFMYPFIPTPSGNSQFVLCLYESVFVSFYLILLLKGILEPQFGLKFPIFSISLHGFFFGCGQTQMWLEFVWTGHS